MFKTGGVWCLAGIEIFKALWAIALFIVQQITHTIDGTNKAWNERALTKQLAEVERKATMWERGKQERDALVAQHKADLAALKIKQEQDRAELMRKATEMAERQAKLKALWEKK
ncbi:MAG: hypothetical protein ACRCTP_17780 [Aeromonas popoffii]|uniref:hypothetical protein n=1 Tax=Aeromonas popoffii TaxID=70856 RepID=UPI003F3ECD96